MCRINDKAQEVATLWTTCDSGYLVLMKLNVLNFNLQKHLITSTIYSKKSQRGFEGKNSESVK